MTRGTDPTPTPGRRRGRPRGERLLSAEAVVAAALAVLDEAGAGALSMRRVADVLGVHVNALYTYISDRRALEAAVVEHLLASLDLNPTRGEPQGWRRRVQRDAMAVRAMLRDHPGAVPLFMTAPMNGPHALAVGERLLQCFVDAGLGPADAARATYTVIVYVLGFAALDVAETDGVVPMPAERDRVEARRAGLAAIDPGAFPLSARVAPTMAGWVGERQFRWGLDALLDGIAASVSR